MDRQTAESPVYLVRGPSASLSRSASRTSAGGAIEGGVSDADDGGLLGTRLCLDIGSDSSREMGRERRGCVDALALRKLDRVELDLDSCGVFDDDRW